MREQCLYSRTSFECLAPVTATTPSQSLSFGLITSLGSQEPSVLFWEALLLCFDEGLGGPKGREPSEEMQTRKPHRRCFRLPSCQRFPPPPENYSLLFLLGDFTFVGFMEGPIPSLSHHHSTSPTFLLLELSQECPNSYPCF